MSTIELSSHGSRRNSEQAMYSRVVDGGPEGGGGSERTSSNGDINESNQFISPYNIKGHKMKDPSDRTIRSPYNTREYWVTSMNEMVLGTKTNILLLLLPFAFIGDANHWDDGVVFWLALLSLIPLAERLSFVTEQLALHTNKTIGGLLNATFGNLTELIVCLLALKDGKFIVIQLSLLGSVLSNLLLVLGFAFLVGGMRFKNQYFNEVSGHVNAGLLMLAAMSLVFPMALKATDEDYTEERDVASSRFISLVLFVNYLLYLVFQLKTHTDEFEDDNNTNNDNKNSEKKNIIKSDSMNTTDVSDNEEIEEIEENDDDDDDDDEEEDILGFGGAIFWLTIITIAISCLSDALVAVIEGAAIKLGISSVFICAVLIPIAGNAAEHGAAVIFAYRNKMDIVMGIALGSGSQVALLVLPIMVLFGWMMDEDLTLIVEGFEAAAFLITIITVTFIVTAQNGKSNWLVGAILISCYIVLCIGFWDHKDHDLDNMTRNRRLTHLMGWRD